MPTRTALPLRETRGKLLRLQPQPSRWHGGLPEDSRHSTISCPDQPHRPRLVHRIGEPVRKIHSEPRCSHRTIARSAEDQHFLWTADYTSAFNAAKNTLRASPTLSFFQVGHPLKLETDASVLKGLGFVLWQQQGDGWQIIKCGSRYLSDTETRYAIIERELLEIVWANQKYKLYLAGAFFQVTTDHWSLVPMWNNYSLDQVEKPRHVGHVLKIRLFQRLQRHGEIEPQTQLLMPCLRTR